MGKVLLIASIAPMIEAFNKGNLQILQDLGNEVHVAANFYEEDTDLYEKNQEFKEWLTNKGVTVYDLPIQRSPLSKENWHAYKLLKNIMEGQAYSMVHAHSPIGGVLARLAGRHARKKGMNVVYTAHGFHFFKGAPLKNWMLYYPVEKYLSKWTDCLITINPEDYARARKNEFQSKEIAYVNGVGIDLSTFSPTDSITRKRLRSHYGMKKDAFIMICVGEISYRKNQQFAIEIMPSLLKRVPNALLLLVGEGDIRDDLEQQIKDKGLQDHVKMLGFRSDIPELMALSDVGFSASRQEGLPVNVMEAMASGLPVVVSDCRGNRDLVTQNENGFVFPENEQTEVVNRLEKLALSADLREQFGRTNRKVIEPFAVDQVGKEMTRIYKKYTIGPLTEQQNTPHPAEAER